jgi:hypothetical protein
MGYQIRMVPQVETWLADVRDRDPAAADRIDEAITVLRADGESVGPPLVVPVDDLASRHRAASMPGGATMPRRGGLHGHVRKPWHGKPASDAPRWLLGRIGFWIALPGLDAAYQRQRLTLARVRRGVATVATSRKRLELQAGLLEQQVGQSRAGMEAGQGGIADEGQVNRDTTERLASLRRHHADMQAKEERLFVASRRLQAEINAFRAGKEAIEATYTAAEEAAEAAWAELIDDVGASAEGAGSAAGDAVNAGPDGPPRPAFWLSELRPGAPESADARILFTVEPPGTAVLLAAGMERDRLRAWYTEAIANCRIRYQREQWSPPCRD